MYLEKITLDFVEKRNYGCICNGETNTRMYFRHYLCAYFIDLQKAFDNVKGKGWYKIRLVSKLYMDKSIKYD